MAPFLGEVASMQLQRIHRYVEPYAGGAGAALRLLLEDRVGEIVMNDLDPGVAAMWRSIFSEPETVAHRLETVIVDIEEWHRQRAIYADPAGRSDIDLGFATLFLNRTNRSGILNARPIGGLSQDGPYGMAVRFNRTDLAKRVRLLGRFRSRVTVCEEDGVDVVRRFASRNTLIYADPPYLEQGSDLYLDGLDWAGHQALAAELQGRRTPWLVTYDDDPRVGALYPRCRRARFPIAHTAARQHVGWEQAVFSGVLRLPELPLLT